MEAKFIQLFFLSFLHTVYSSDISLLSNAIGSPTICSTADYDPDVDLTTPNIIRRHGYPAESHTVQTADGYLLTMHRIPHSKSSPDQGSKPAVFLQHGLLASSADFITTGPGKALAYILSDSGYDVWMGNARGNTYSRSHTSLNTNDAAFWNFSFHEMGVYDLPAEIDHILNVTGQDNIFYIGHSMGTTMFYVLSSTRTEYNTKIKAMFGLAPVAFLTHVKSPIRLIAPWADDIEFVSKFLGTNEFLPQNKVLRFLAKYGCEAVATEKKICENVLFVLCGYDEQQFNQSLLPMILSHTPAGTATKVLVHFAQLIRTGKFEQYDLGVKANLATYGQTTPPEYNLTNIDVPIALHVADNDWLASFTDVNALAAKLRKLIGKYVVPFPLFNHLDFLWGKDAKTLVYDTLLDIMKNVTQHSVSWT